MLRALIAIQLLSLLNSFFNKSGIKRKRSAALKILIAVFAIYVIACFFFMFGGFFKSICSPMASTGFAWLYFSIAALTSVALCFIGSVFVTKAQLFDAKDNDLLMSMPIPPGYILLSRIIMLLVLNYAFELLVMAPAGVVYCINYGSTLTGVVFFIIEFLFLPLLPLTLSCIFGWLIAVIGEKVRNKSFVTTSVSLIFLALYFYFIFQINSYLQALLQNIGFIGAKIRSLVFPVYHFGLAISDKNAVSLVFFLLCVVIPFGIVWAALEHNFVRIATTRKGFAKIKYKEQPMKVSNPKHALLKKELSRFFSTPVYILNASLGVVFILAFAVLLIIYRDLPGLIISEMPQFEPYLGPLLIAVVCALVSTNVISAPSVSLEGKSIWILQSLPVDGGDVLLAKVKLHILICLPSVFLASLALIFTVKLSLLQILLTFLLPAIFTVFCALSGVVINLRFPKLDWINETVVIKQSLSTGISILVSMAAVMLPAVLYVFLLIHVMAAEFFMLIILIILSALCLIMYRYLKTKGSAVFRYLV